MLTIAHPHSASQEIRKSRFVAHCAAVSDEAEVRTFLGSHADSSATHHCWAWRIGQTYRFSDDGEPSGTAGKPILQAIDGQGLDHVAVLVLRWFGGTLLGSGGLMRAYGGTAAIALQGAGRIEHIAMARGRVSVAFADLALVKTRLAGLGAVLIDERFTATGADLLLDIPANARESAGTTARDITSGRAQIRFETESGQ